MSLVISIPCASGSKAQMVGPHGAVRATILVTSLGTLCSWRSLSTSRNCFVILGIVCTCSHGGCLLGAVSAEVAALGLLWRMVLVQA